MLNSIGVFLFVEKGSFAHYHRLVLRAVVIGSGFVFANCQRRFAAQTTRPMICTSSPEIS